jgi:hypothetical protein
MIVIIVIGRYLAVYISYYVFECLPGSQKNKLNFSQITFIAFAALIRGSIAFGLVLKIKDIFRDNEMKKHLNPLDPESDEFKVDAHFCEFSDLEGSKIKNCYFLDYHLIEVIESTTSALVIITTIVFGGVTSVI